MNSQIKPYFKERSEKQFFSFIKSLRTEKEYATIEGLKVL